MILTCPQCTTRYLLPATALAPDGHNVRCSNCAEVWYQEPDYDELAELQAGEDDAGEAEAPVFDDIPEGVKPDIELDLVDREDAQEEGEALPLKARLISYAAAAAVFFLILGALVMLKSPMVQAWPPSAGLYQMLGMEIAVPGEGLVFDHLKITANPSSDHGETISLSGRIVNLTAHAQVIPAVEASLRGSGGEIVETWYLAVPEKRIDAEGTLDFAQDYIAAQTGAHEVSLKFVLNQDGAVKTASEDGDNTHAPASDDHAHPIGGAKDQESHAPASAPHH